MNERMEPIYFFNSLYREPHPSSFRQFLEDYAGSQKNNLWSLASFAIRKRKLSFARYFIDSVEDYPPITIVSLDMRIFNDDPLETIPDLKVKLTNVLNYTTSAKTACLNLIFLIMNPWLNNAPEIGTSEGLVDLFKLLWRKIDTRWLSEFKENIVLSNFFSRCIFKDDEWLHIFKDYLMTTGTSFEMVDNYNKTATLSYAYISKLLEVLRKRHVASEYRMEFLRYVVHRKLSFGIGDLSSALLYFGHAEEFHYLIPHCLPYLDEMHWPCALSAYVCCVDTDHSDMGHYQLFDNTTCRRLDIEERSYFLRMSLGYYAISTRLSAMLRGYCDLLRPYETEAVAMLSVIPRVGSLKQFARDTWKAVMHQHFPGEFFYLAMHMPMPDNLRDILTFKVKLYDRKPPFPTPRTVYPMLPPPPVPKRKESRVPTKPLPPSPSSSSSSSSVIEMLV